MLQKQIVAADSRSLGKNTTGTQGWVMGGFGVVQQSPPHPSDADPHCLSPPPQILPALPTLGLVLGEDPESPASP